MMMVLVTYDVNTESAAGRKRLQKIAKACCNYGQRVQNSVFECSLTQAQFRELQDKLTTIMNMETDSLRFYMLGDKYDTKIQHYGIKAGYEPEGFLSI